MQKDEKMKKIFKYLKDLFYVPNPTTLSVSLPPQGVSVRTEVFTLRAIGLQVYATQPADEVDRMSPTKFFWRDEANPQGYGPFAKLSECVQHYDYLNQLMRNGTTAPSPGLAPLPVIKVNFGSKRRIPLADETTKK